MEARGDWAGIRRLFLTATRWVLYLVVPVNLGLWAFGRPFLVRWVGPEVGGGGFPVAAVLAAALTIGVAQSVASRLLYGLGRLRAFARLALVEAGLNLVLTVAYVLPLGVVGVAAGVAGPNLLFCIAVLAHTLRIVGVPVGQYLRDGWAKPLAAGAIPAAIWGLSGPAEPTWPGIAAGIAVGLVPYAATVLLLEVRLTLPAAARRAVGVAAAPADG
jgi:O-antigen/teichoic acid export membrane protein